MRKFIRKYLCYEVCGFINNILCVELGLLFICIRNGFVGFESEGLERYFSKMVISNCISGIEFLIDNKLENINVINDKVIILRVFINFRF